MVCRSVFVWAFPEILSARHGPGNFPSLRTMATRALKKVVQDAISCVSALLSLENPHSRVRHWHPWKTSTITQGASCSLTLSVLVFLLRTEWKYKWRNANVPCSQAQIAVQQATVRSLWSFSKPEKHMKNICTGSHKGRLDTSAVWFAGTKESSSLWNFRSFDTEKKVVVVTKGGKKNLWNTNSLIFKQA